MRFSRITPILLLLAACDDNGEGPSDTNVDPLPPIINRPLPEFGTLTIGSDVRILPPDARPFPGIDTDGDGLYDAFELEQGLDPLNPDTDGDGIHDHWDLLGSEHALQTQTDDGFAWFDPSATELLPPDIAASTVYNPPISGIHIQRTEPSHVVLFGISQYRPLHAPCIAPPNAPASCSARYTGNEMSNPTSVRLDVEASPYGQQLMWEMTTNVRIGSMSPDWIYEDDRVFQPQTAPILGVPARN